MKKIESPITAMIDKYNYKLAQLNRFYINNLSNSDNAKELIFELKGMKEILEASGMIKFFSDGSCDIITFELIKEATQEMDKSCNQNHQGSKVMFRNASSGGNYTNTSGNGEISLNIARINSEYMWLDLGNIYFTNPDKEQLMTMETGSSCSKDQREYTNHKRRLSFKQASYIASEIAGFINDRFRGKIPSDKEIDDENRKCILCEQGIEHANCTFT